MHYILSQRGDFLEWEEVYENTFYGTLKNDVDCSYLIGLANNQTLQVKVYPQNLTKDGFNANTASGAINTAMGSDFTFRLFSNKSTMTNAERNLLNNQVVPKRTWSSGTAYDMYRQDYSRTNIAKVSGSTSLYLANYLLG